ncbi:hypothetical protein [Shewanella phage FishSpeaker]|nr:hypothetical protein [Shewanella phage FishSpeaker]
MPILPDEAIKLKHEEFDFSSLSALIEDIREKRKKLLIKKYILDKITQMVNEEPDHWVLVIRLLGENSSNKVQGSIKILQEDSPYGFVNVHVSKDGIFVNTPYDNSTLVSELLKNKTVEKMVKSIMFLYGVFMALSLSVGCKFICDIDNHTIDTKPLTDPQENPIEIIGESYGGKELLYYVINEIIKP